MAGLELNLQRVMIFGAHPDDEIIGPGGIIHKFASQGVETYAVIFTDGGTTANSIGEMPHMIQIRKDEMKESGEILGIKKRELLQIPCQHIFQAHHGGEMVYDLESDNHKLTLHQKLIKLIRAYKPDLIFTHSLDNHRDHCAIAEATPHAVFQSAEDLLGHLGKPWSTPLLLYYSVEQELMGDFSPNIILQIEEENLEAKLRAMKTQVSQTRTDGYLEHHIGMIKSRASLWGAKYFGHNAYAEPFHLRPSYPCRIAI